ncbi:MAG: hypothetical protein M3081_21805 [Gemmatimonadota bacterium]|nr:hypothetical protein [Gemmatimonadota bacterium]
MHRRSHLVCLLAAATLATACGKKDAAVADSAAPVTPATTTPAPAPVAGSLSVTDVTLGKQIGSDKHVAAPTDTFGTRDTIYASVITTGAGQNAKLSARWMYQGKQVVNEHDEMISPTGGSTATEFHIQKPSAWPKGQYSVQVLLDGAVANTKTFRVQ